MPTVMPSQVVATIDMLFPHAAREPSGAVLMASHSARLKGIIDLVKMIPSELIVVPADQYADLILSISTIESSLETWISRGETGTIPHVRDGLDAITLIRRIVARCPDEFPPTSASADLAFIADPQTLDDMRRDIGAANRAFGNGEWKAATILGGATIEALLHWRLSQLSAPQIADAISALASASGGRFNASPNPDDWVLYQFIEVSRQLGLIQAETATASNLARNFRNLIHPGAAARRGQVCDRGSALSALAALEHVIRDLSPP